MYSLRLDRIFPMFLEKFAITTYPRKGTETSTIGSSHSKKPLQLIPVRGRKKPLELIHGHLNYNLSPRGDGNFLAFVFVLIFEQITTYPRKGTEKNLGTDPLDKHYNLPPQGDNKTPPSLAFYQQRRCFVLSLFYLQVTGQAPCLRKWSL